MCVCTCMYASFGRTVGRICTILFGGGRVSSGEFQLNTKYLSSKLQDVFDVTHLKHKKIFFNGKNLAQVAFRRIISTGIVCNEHCILFQ